MSFDLSNPIDFLDISTKSELSTIASARRKPDRFIIGVKLKDGREVLPEAQIAELLADPYWSEFHPALEKLKADLPGQNELLALPDAVMFAAAIETVP